MTRKLLCAACILASALLYLYTGTAAALFLVLTSVLLPSSALLLAALSADKLSVSLRVPADLRKGERVHCTLCVETRTWIPVSYAELLLLVTNTLTGQEERIPLTFSAAPYEKKEADLSFTSGCCGQFVFTCGQMRVFDFLGLRAIRKGIKIHEKRTVPPELFGTRVTLTGTQSPPGGGETFSVALRGQDKTEPFQIREYAEGDNRRQIHWKLTQKLDRYIVIDPSLELEAALLMLWDGAPLPEGTPPQVPDALAEAFISACIALAEEGVPYAAAWKSGESGEVVIQDVSQMDDVYNVVPGILCANAGAGAALIPELLLKLDGKSYPLTAYFSYQAPQEQIPTGKLTSFICKPEGAAAFTSDDGASAPDECVVFTPANYENILREINI